MKLAVDAKTPQEFADGVERATLEEAKSIGFTDDELNELKKKFESARTHIQNADDSDGAEGSKAGTEDDASGRDNNDGSGDTHQQEGQGDSSVLDPR